MLKSTSHPSQPFAAGRFDRIVGKTGSSRKARPSDTSWSTETWVRSVQAWRGRDGASRARRRGMLKRIWKRPSRSYRHEAGSRAFAGRSRRKLLLEVLEARQLLTASLATLSDISVPALLGLSGPTRRQRDHQPPSPSRRPRATPTSRSRWPRGSSGRFTVSHTPSGHAATSRSTTRPMTFQFFPGPHPEYGHSHHHI